MYVGTGTESISKLKGTMYVGTGTKSVSKTHKELYMYVGTGTKSISKLKRNYVCRNRSQISK